MIELIGLIELIELVGLIELIGLIEQICNIIVFPGSRNVFLI